jgi:hypothetical protein
MRNVAPSRSLVRRANQVKTLSFMLGAAGIFVLALGIFLNVVPLVAPANPGHGLYTIVHNLAIGAGVALIIGAVVLVLRAFTWKVDNDSAIQLGQVLAGQLGDDYTLIRNISKLNIGYVDAALVGPPGVLIFRLFEDSGAFVNEGENWLLVRGRTQTGAPNLVPARFSPTRQTQADIDKVKAHLTTQNLSDVPITGMVVLMHEPPAARIERLIKPSLPVTHLSGVWMSLQQAYLTDARIDRAKADNVVRALFGEPFP